MAQIEITLSISEELAQDAEEFGLLNTEQIVHLLRSEVDKRIMDEVNAEIQDYRAEKRQKSDKA